MREEVLIATTLAWVALLAPEPKAAALDSWGFQQLSELSTSELHRISVAARTVGTSARRRRRTASAVSQHPSDLHQKSISRSLRRSPLRKNISKVIANETIAAFALPVSGDDDDEPNFTLELILGIGVGILLSATTACVWAGCCKPKIVSKPSASAPPSKDDFAGDLMDLPTVYYGGAFFRQFSWCLDSSGIDPETGALRVLDADGRQVVQVVGRLMATPNGEVQLLNSGGITWAGLKRPVPSRRQGQLWDFRVYSSGGIPYAEVKQRSETKAVVVEPPPTQRRLMTVIGNFAHRVFLTGERSIHIWTAGDDRHSLAAQCEVRVEAVRCSEAQGPGGQHVVTPVRSFYVSATMLVDAPLAMAVLIGLQQVHTRLGYVPPVPASPGPTVSLPSGASEDCVYEDSPNAGGNSMSSAVAFPANEG